MRSVAPISGFPEWLPPQRRLEQDILRHLERVFELHGFCSLETRAVEHVSTLTSKGHAEAEIYGVRRLADLEGAGSGRLGLHFDLTVPLARYVLEHGHQLVFPFCRYQAQKVWRGERAQAGRFREFSQVDFDIVGHKELPWYAERECLSMLLEAFDGPAMPTLRLRVSDRRLMESLLAQLQVAPVGEALSALDRLDKIGRERVLARLFPGPCPSREVAEQLCEVAALHGDATAVERGLDACLGGRVDVAAPLASLARLLEGLGPPAKHEVDIDLGIVRGLDYYTGIVFEGAWRGRERLGAICSGGRYDDLARQLGGREAFPGVGASVGLTRILSELFGADAAATGKHSGSQVVVGAAAPGEAGEAQVAATAATLRRRGIPCEMSPAPLAGKHRLRLAQRRGVPYVMTVASGAGAAARITCLSTGEEREVDPERWRPGADVGA